MALQEQSRNIALLQDTPGLVELQQRMQLSLVATPADPTAAAPSVVHIFEAMESVCGKSCLPTLITAYAPDFILHFDCQESRDAVLSMKVLTVHSSTLSLSQWTPYYRSQVIEWETEVIILVSQIPVEACHPDILLPLLSNHCDIRSYTFDKSEGTCEIVAFCYMPSAIPKSATVAYPFRTPRKTILMTHPVSISTRAAPIPSEEIPDHPLFKAFSFEFEVDPDVLFEANRAIDAAEDMLRGRVHDFDDTSSSGCSMDYDGYSARLMDSYSPSDDLSDREPADWRGRNI